MVAVPAATPVTTPVEAPIVATPVEPDVQVPPDTLDVKVVVPFEHNVCVPLNVPADGTADTVMVPVAFTVPQPPVNGIE